ncbi:MULTISPECIES: hypothetical protein [Ruegeria]|uniref:hypothetical protein n=1 Tax=Ruegeria TaxID=97050 RepID=UPI00147E2124|nr:MULTISPECIES: hypothetical protein [Ruegeria]
MHVEFHEANSFPASRSFSDLKAINKYTNRARDGQKFGPQKRKAERTLVREIARVTSALEKAALLVIKDPTYVPIMERLEHELCQMQEQLANCPVERALAIVQKKEIS